MKELVTSIHNSIFICFVTIILQACGGSGSKTPTYSISTTVNHINFSNEVSQPTSDSVAIDITFEGPGLLIGFSPESQPASWLKFRTENVTANSATIYVDVVNAEFLMSDSYQTKIRLSTGEVNELNLVHHDIDISLLIWQLSTNTNLVSFRGTSGDDSIAPIDVDITSESNEWTAAVDVDWLTLSATSGIGSAVITVTPDLTAFSHPGLQQANIILTETTSGDTKTLPVELALDNVYLYADQANIAFTHTQNISATERTVTIASNGATLPNWQATTEANWLTLTTLADTNQLKITANPALVANNESAQASIIVSTSQDTGTIAETIKVYLYQSEQSTENQTITDIVTNANAVIASPTLPLVYMGINNELHIYHQYSGELITSLSVSPTDTLLTQFVMHPNGELLLAKAIETISNEDETTSTVIHRYKINLNDHSVSEIENANLQYEPLDFVRFAGRYFVVSQALEYADENLQTLFWDTQGAFITTTIDTALQTNSLFALDNNTASFKRYTAKINDFSSQKIITALSHDYHPETLAAGAGIRDFVVTNDEKNIYLISASSEWISFDGDSFTDHGLLESSENVVTLALDKSSNGRPHYFRVDPSSGLGFYVDVYNEQQQQAAKIYTQGNQASSMQVSADDKRLIANILGGESIELVNLTQFESSSQSLSFEGTYGDQTIAAQTLSLTGVGQGWQASADVAWITLTIDAENNNLVVNINNNEINTWGLHTGTITIQDPASGTSQVIIVTLAIDEIRLFSNYPSLTFNSQMDQSTLSHTVNILNNGENTVVWSAVSNVDWLTLTPNLSENTLTITADPSKISTNGTYYGQITLSPTNSEDSTTGIIEVSFTKGDFDSSILSEIVIENISPNSAGIVLDPLRPYIYIAQLDKIEVYNIVDGKKVASINSPLINVNLTNLVIHPNGSLLLATNIETYLDENNTEQTRDNYYVVNLTDFSIKQLDNELIDIEFSPEKIIMVSGEAVVVSQALEYANLALQRQFWQTDHIFITSIIEDIRDNNNFIAFDGATATLRQYSLQYHAFTTTSTTVVSSSEYSNPAFSNGITHLAANSAGTDLYTANTASDWSHFDGERFVDQGLLDNNALSIAVSTATDSADNSFIYRFNAIFGVFTLSKYNNNQQALWTVGYSAGSTNVYLSPDYQRMIHYDVNNKKLVLDYIPN